MQSSQPTFAGLYTWEDSVTVDSRLADTSLARTPRYYGQQQKPRRLTEINSRYYGLSLLRTYGHFIRSQRHNFVLLSRYSGHRAASWNICRHIKCIFFFSFLRLSLSFLVDFHFLCPSIKIPSSFSLKALFAVSLPWISSSSLFKGEVHRADWNDILRQCDSWCNQ